MKKLISTALCVLLTASLVACSSPKSTTPQPEENPPTVEPQTPEEPQAPETSAEVKEPVFIADAAIYRGTVTATSKDGESFVYELEEYEGTDYGADKISIYLAGSAMTNIAPEQIVTGNYVEIFYAGSIEAGIDGELLEAVGLNFIGESPEAVNFNGIIEEINPHPDKEGEGSILLTDLNGENETIFNYNSNGETQFYLNFEDLTVGDKISVYHGSAVAMSLPPQIFAIEVRHLAETVISE